jgi:predicted  nucleic acid-binding Zn-ribbon protein
MSQLAALVGLLGLLLMLTGLVRGQSRRARADRERIDVLEDALLAQQRAHSALERRLDGLESTLVGLGRHLERLAEGSAATEDLADRLRTRIDQVETRLLDEGGAYAQAIRRVSRGNVSENELIQDFGIPRNEAELLIRLHKARAAEEGGRR